MKVDVCCLNKPIGETPNMHTNTQFRDQLFSKNTKRDYLDVLKEWGFVTGLFSNMDEKEREQFNKFKEKIA